jgi:mxaL protein
MKLQGLRERVRDILQGWRSDRTRWPLALAVLALAATFLQPSVQMQRALFEHVVVLDITQSMNVPDQVLGGQPVSRLAYAKHALHGALQTLPCGSKLGWAVFTENRSYLLIAPLEVCVHRAELRATLAGIDGTMAWSGNSEIAKGLHSGVLTVKALPGTPSLVFVTDGQEAPPLSPQHRPAFDDKPGEVAGVIVGVGELKASPIPKRDPQGRPLGVWSADEVAQVSPRSQGRSGSVGGERMVEDGSTEPVPGGLGATPGTEHLSGLHEHYLQLLAAEHRFAYLHLRAPQGLADSLSAMALARPVTVRADARPALATLALLLLLAPYALAFWRRWRRAQVEVHKEPS